LTAINSSTNTLDEAGSGMYVTRIPGLAMSYVVLESDAHVNVLTLNHYIVGNLFCIVITNCSCQSSHNWPGLVYVGSVLRVSDSVFVDNVFDYFVGAFESEGGSLLLVDATFDGQNMTATGGAVIECQGCTTETDIDKWPITDCPWRKPAAKLSTLAIVGIVIAAVVLVAAIVCTVVCLLRRRRDDRGKEKVLSETLTT
jgi:hypothetical protein